MKPIRNSARAIIIQDNRVLLTKNKDEQGFFYLFPGGGQEKGEPLSEAIRRECLEELGSPVKVHDLRCVREYIGRNHEFAEWDGDLHQVEFYFHCSLEGPLDSRQANHPDDHQVGVEWFEMEQLASIRIYPRSLARQLMQGQPFPNYLGDTN